MKNRPLRLLCAALPLAVALSAAAQVSKLGKSEGSV